MTVRDTIDTWLTTQEQAAEIPHTCTIRLPLGHCHLCQFRQVIRLLRAYHTALRAIDAQPVPDHPDTVACALHLHEIKTIARQALAATGEEHEVTDERIEAA